MRVRGALTGLAALAAALTVTAPAAGAACKAELEVLETGSAASVWPKGGTIGVTIPIAGEGERAARGVVVTGVRTKHATVSGKLLPVRLGTVGHEEVRQLQLRLTPDGRLRRSYRLDVRGRYAKVCRFAVDAVVKPRPRDDRRTFKPRKGEALVQRTKGAEFPPSPARTVTEPNAETPILVPPGPRRRLFPPTPTPSRGATPGAAALVDVNLNSSSANAGMPPDPSTARDATGVVLSTFNLGISWSTDGGASFTDVNLLAPVAGQPGRTTFFPESDGGLCCDQVVIYVPDQDLFVWLMQYWPRTNAAGTAITQASRLRVAWARPADVRADFTNAWSYLDLTATNVPGVSTGLGTAANEHLDYPDLAYSRENLYVGIDRGWPNAPGSVYSGRRIVARLALSQLLDATASTVGYQFIEYSGSNGLNKSHFVQGAGERMVLGSLDDTSTLRVFTWRDSSGSAQVSTTPISSITTGPAYSAPAPDGTDWYAVSFPGNITGATSLRGQYVFAFDGGINGRARPRPFVRLETVTPSANGANATAEYDVWNPDYAFAMAALGTQPDGLGMGLAVGGGTIGYPQFAVGYKDDFTVYTVTASNATQTTAGGGSRFGDYFAVRPIPGSTGFAAATYDVLQSTAGQTCQVGGCRAVTRYVEFRRAPPG